MTRPVRDNPKGSEFPSRFDIFNYPSQTLRELNEDIVLFDNQLKKLIRNLFTMMYKLNGLGLSAPQVGINKRILVFNEFLYCPTTEIALVNPKIVWKSPDVSTNLETCLSFPKVIGHVTRSRQVRVAYQDLDGSPQTIEFYGNPAIIFQHEYDHLEGVLFIDHFNDAEKLAAEERLFLLSKVHRKI